MPDAHKTNHPCGKCAFYNSSVWQPVETSSISVLSRGFLRNGLDAGQRLFEQDAKNNGVYCVSKGLIALRTHHVDGSSTLLRLAYPGDVIGFRSFLGSGRHQTEARALLPSRVCAVARREATQVVHDNHPVLTEMASRCIAEIDRGHKTIIATATTSNKQRLANLLLFLMKLHGEGIGGRIQMNLPLSRSDLADLIGVQPETMSRLISRLRAEGSFSFSGRLVQIPAAMLSTEKVKAASTV